MQYHTVILSDDLEFRVPRLGVFELDDLRPKPLGAFTYKMEMAGKEYDVEYDTTAWPTPPEKPDIPEHEIKPNTNAYYDLENWKLYQVANRHNQQRIHQEIEYVESVARYILRKCPDDINRIRTQEDWQKVYNAALVPQLTLEKLADTLEKTYQAQFEDQDVFTALQNIGRDSGGTYNTLRVWENELMMRMQMTELEYALLPLDERARKVCSLFLPEIMSALQMDRDSKKREANKNNTTN